MNPRGEVFGFGPGDTVAVLTRQPVNRLLDYRIPEGGAQTGCFVEVPLGPRTVTGVVWGPGRGQFDRSKLRAIKRILDVPPMRPEMLRFLNRASEYTVSPLNSLLALATRVQGLGDPPKFRQVYVAGEGRPSRMTPARQRVLDIFRGQPDAEFSLGDLVDEARVSASVIKGLADQDCIIRAQRPWYEPFPTLDLERPGPELTAQQLRAAEHVKELLGRGEHKACLLKGVTGSGKTAVYLDAVRECLRGGRQALVMLPEIALTEEFLNRVGERFGVIPAVWHSSVSSRERRRCWRMVAENRAQLVVGARSALFLPFADLGIIVVDEEHDSSFKQEEGVLYNARDMAVLRASICRAVALLVSATPSLESWVNWKSGKYSGVDLPKRFGAATLPELRAIDLCQEQLDPGHWISPSLAEEVESSLKQGKQALLFLNRRGYAPVTICRACGHQIGCEQCDARLVLHQMRRLLMCHQCGETRAVPSVCTNCGTPGKLAAIGPGVERLAEEAFDRFPDARLTVFSSDLAQSGHEIQNRIREITDGKVDIVIGTQMVAKGHHFPLLRTVGVIDADLGLRGGDLRAAERTFQLIHQVSGRAGRDGTRGVSLIQTHQPEHPVIKAILSGDGEAFRRTEADYRKAAGVPPFGRFAAAILSGADLGSVNRVAQELARNAGILRNGKIELYGPAPAPIARVRGRYRVRFLAKSAREIPIQGKLLRWRDSVKLPSGIRMQIDVDPQSFL